MGLAPDGCEVARVGRATLGDVAGWLVGVILCAAGLGGLLETELEDVLLGATLAAAGVFTLPPIGRLVEHTTGVRPSPALRVGVVVAVLMLIRFVKS